MHRRIDRLALTQFGRVHGQFRVAEVELAGRADDRTHLVAARKRLLDHLPADPAGRAEHDDSARAG